MSSKFARIRDLETQIRDFITHPRVQYQLLQDKLGYYTLCSSLDVIGDTELAIAAYLALPDENAPGLHYLVIYGVLQACFVQQDGARHILESLSIESPLTDDLKYVRELRAMTVDHPTNTGIKGKPLTTNAISRFSLHRTGFLLMSTPATGDHEMIEVNITELLDRQRSGITRLLEIAVVELIRREEEHRMKFKDKKLVSFFDPQLSYFFEKISEGCHGDRDRRIFHGLPVDALIEALAGFRQALAERGVLPANSAIEEDLQNAEYPLRELKFYFEENVSNTLNQRSSSIFAFYLKHQMGELKKIAMDIDAEYSAPVVNDTGTNRGTVNANT